MATDAPGIGGDAGKATGNADTGAALAAYFDARFGQPGHRVTELVRLSGGASRETFGFSLHRPDRPDAPRPLILQRVRSGALSATFSMEGEASLLGAALDAGVPVAAVVTACDDASVLGAPFIVLAHVEGETIARRILRDAEYETARARLVAHCAEALARIHALAVDAAPHLRADDPVRQLRGLLDVLGEAHPAFELGFRWLDAHRPAVAVEARVVHGDFRLGNLIVDGQGLAAVIDWELAHLGDPMEDLGWFCVRAWRFGLPAPVAGLGSYDELFDAYEAASGREVDRDAVRWWEVLGTLRWGIICILQASGHLSGASRSVELAAIGRRVCETEHDVLALLGVPAPAVPELADGYDGGAHGAPSAPQLIEAVREYLERDVLAATTGRVQFHARVAAKALATVERELAAGPAMADAHRARLRALGCADDAELAAAIRAGDLDDRMDEVTEAVARTVAEKLAVANPSYAGEETPAT